MPAMELLCQLMGINTRRLSKEENLILEAEVYMRICNEILCAYRSKHKDYFELIKFDRNKENTMMELNFIRCLINDIVESKAYTLSGIAYYTQIPEDVIEDLLLSCHANLLLTLPHKLIELHRSVRPEIYQDVIRKISDELT